MKIFRLLQNFIFWHQIKDGYVPMYCIQRNGIPCGCDCESYWLWLFTIPNLCPHRRADLYTYVCYCCIYFFPLIGVVQHPSTLNKFNPRELYAVSASSEEWLVGWQWHVSCPHCKVSSQLCSTKWNIGDLLINSYLLSFAIYIGIVSLLAPKHGTIPL